MSVWLKNITGFQTRAGSRIAFEARWLCSVLSVAPSLVEPALPLSNYFDLPPPSSAQLLGKFVRYVAVEESYREACTAHKSNTRYTLDGFCACSSEIATLCTGTPPRVWPSSLP
jgi:hypothetical protein